MNEPQQHQFEQTIQQINRTGGVSPPLSKRLGNAWAIAYHTNFGFWMENLDMRC